MRPVAEELEAITRPEQIPKWTDEFQVSEWANNVLDCQMAVTAQARNAEFDVDGPARTALDTALAVGASLRRPVIVAALRAGQPLTLEQRTLLAGLLEERPKRGRGRPKVRLGGMGGSSSKRTASEVGEKRAHLLLEAVLVRLLSVRLMANLRGINRGMRPLSGGG